MHLCILNKIQRGKVSEIQTTAKEFIGRTYYFALGVFFTRSIPHKAFSLAALGGRILGSLLTADTTDAAVNSPGEAEEWTGAAINFPGAAE